MELRNDTSDVVGSVEGVSLTGAHCYAGFAQNTVSNNRLWGYYYLDLGSGYALLKANDAWIVENVTTRGYGLFNLLKGFADSEDWGETHNRREFSKIVAFFFIMIVLIGVFTFTTGYDFAQPGGALLLVLGLVALGSFAGIFDIKGISAFSFFNKYAIFFITSFLTWGFLIDHWRSSSQ
jgi:hypothetical protein